MAKRSFGSRSIDHRHQQRIIYHVPDSHCSCLPFVVHQRFVRQKVRLSQHCSILVSFHDGISFFEEPGDRVDDSGGIRPIYHLHQRRFVFLFRRLNVDERASGNHCRQLRGPKQDIRIVHLVDFIHCQNIVSEFVKYHPICEGIHRFGAPPQTGIECPQFRRRTDAKVSGIVLHVVVFVPEIHPLPFLVQFSPKVFHTHVVAHSFPPKIFFLFSRRSDSARNIRSDGVKFRPGVPGVTHPPV